MNQLATIDVSGASDTNDNDNAPAKELVAA